MALGPYLTTQSPRELLQIFAWEPQTPETHFFGLQWTLWGIDLNYFVEVQVQRLSLVTDVVTLFFSELAILTIVGRELASLLLMGESNHAHGFWTAYPYWWPCSLDFSKMTCFQLGLLLFSNYLHTVQLLISCAEVGISSLPSRMPCVPVC